VQSVVKSWAQTRNWKEAVDKDMNDLHIKLDLWIVDCSKWRELITGNWSDRNNDSDMPRAEYELYVSGSGSGSPRLTWINGC